MQKGHVCSYIQITINNMIQNQEYSEIASKVVKSLPKLVPHPSLLPGYTLLYDNTVPIQMQCVDYDGNVNHLGSNQTVNFKLYTFGVKPNISKVKLQIQSQNDPFFISKCDQNTFGLIRREQKLTIDLQELPTVIIKCLNQIEESKKKVSAGMLISSDGKSRLTLNYASEFKNIEIIHLQLDQQNDEKLQEIIKFKYQNLRKQIEKAELRLARINQLIREKNPSLLQQITKTTKSE